MDNIILDVGNNAKNILPVPYTAPPVPSVPSPSNYGSSPFPVALQPSSRKNDDLQYCNYLEPSPRDQRLNVPYQGHKDCPKFTAQPYSKDSCYLLDSKVQGTVGIVCNQAGGSDNANFVRGNQFGVDYPYDIQENMSNQQQDNNQNQQKQQLKYNANKPVQIPMEMENPLVIYDKNTFYPEPSFFLRGNKNFKTYPLQNNYTEYGLPTYTYPYKTLNPIFQDPNQIGIEAIENFDNENNNSHHKIFFIFAILLLIFIFYMYSK